MNFGLHIEQKLPGREWTGASDIHRSMVTMFKFKTGLSQASLVKAVHAFLEGGPKHAWEKYRNQFKEFYPIVGQEDFETLGFVDWGNAMKGMALSETQFKILNPVTQNRFHRVGVYENIVIGARFFCNKEEGLGYRFRLAELKGSQRENRLKTEEAVKVAEKQKVKLREDLHMHEPDHVDGKKREKKQRVTE